MSERLSRRAFFGGTAALVAAGHLPAGESPRPGLADEPPLPPGVAKRLGSARFRELTVACRFTPDSRHLVQLDSDGRCVGYEVATGRRFGWRARVITLTGVIVWVLTDGEVVCIDPSALDANSQPIPVQRFDLHSGRALKTPKLPTGTHYIPTPDGTGVIGYDNGLEGGVLWRTDLRTGKTVWKRKCRTDASVPAALGAVMGKWLVLVGTKQLHLFDPLTGERGPTLEDCPPKDAPPDNHFQLLNFSADGRRVAGWYTADAPGRLVVWDVPTGRVVGRLSPARTDPNFVLSPDGACLFTTCLDAQRQLIAMDVATGRTVRTFPVENIGPLLLSPDGKVLVAPHGEAAQPNGFGGGFGNPVISAGPVRLLDPATGRRLPQSPDPPADLENLRFASPHLLLADTHTEPITLPTLAWDTRTGTARTLPNPWAKAHNLLPLRQTIDYSTDGTRFLHSAGDELVVLDAPTRRKVRAFRLPAAGKGLKDWEQSDLWLTRGRVARLNRTALHVCDLATGRRRSFPLAFKDETNLGGAFAFASADGKTVVVTGADEETGKNAFAMWIDTDDGKATTRPLPKFARVKASADGRRVMVAVENAPEAQPVFVLDRDGRRFPLGQLWEDDPVALSACGRTLLVANWLVNFGTEEAPAREYSVHLLEVATGDVRAKFITPSKVKEMAASPCGRRFATISREAPVYLWDVYGEQSDPRPKPDKAGLLAAWVALGGNADKAFAAVRLLVQHPAEAVRLLKEKLPPAVAIKPEWVQERVVRLDSDDYRTRSTAEQELSAVADRIAGQLEEADADTSEGEARLERLRLRAQAGRLTHERLREVRAVEVLEYAGEASGEVLKALAAGADSLLTREAKAAVRRRAG